MFVRRLMLLAVTLLAVMLLTVVTLARAAAAAPIKATDYSHSRGHWLSLPVQGHKEGSTSSTSIRARTPRPRASQPDICPVE